MVLPIVRAVDRRRRYLRVGVSFEGFVAAYVDPLRYAAAFLVAGDGSFTFGRNLGVYGSSIVTPVVVSVEVSQGSPHRGRHDLECEFAAASGGFLSDDRGGEFAGDGAWD